MARTSPLRNNKAAPIALTNAEVLHSLVGCMGRRFTSASENRHRAVHPARDAFD
jgi:hypothetical protein